MSHRLGYSFASTPNPIRASTSDQNPNKIDLEVRVTAAPGISAAILRGVQISIPVGQHGAAYLSPSPNLPTPSYDETLPWKITASGGKVTIRPIGGALLDANVIFTLPQIVIDDTPDGGVVQVGVFEEWSDGPLSDPNAFELSKEKASFVVLDFEATPDTLDDIDNVTLTWRVNEGPTPLGYNITPANPARPGPFDKNDGATGVPTADIDQDTTFQLLVLQSNVEIGRVAVTVRFEIPKVVSPPSRADVVGRSGRVVAMRWWTENATHCAVDIDQALTDPAAPVQTYRQPYRLLIDGPPRSPWVGTTAYGSKPSINNRQAWQVRVADPAIVPAPNFGKWANVPAITPDGQSMVVATAGGLQVVTLANAQPQGSPLPFPDGLVCGAKLIGSATTGLAWGQGSQQYTLWTASFDLTARTTKTQNHFLGPCTDLLFAADGKTSILTGSDPGTGKGFVIVVPVGADESQWQAPDLQPFADAIGALSLDGTLLFLADIDGNLAVVHMTDGSAEPNRIPIGIGPGFAKIKVTPDGKLVLVHDPWNARIVVVDVATRALSDPPIALAAMDPPNSGMTQFLGIAPDSSYALVQAYPGNGVALVDLKRRVVSPTRLSTLPGFPWSAAFAPDSSAIATVIDGVGYAVL